MKSRETRKLQVIVGSCVVVALAATTASCSSDKENSNSGADNSGSSSAPNASASQDAYPVTIPTKFGEVTISEEPQRVVALGWGDAEAALEFGVRPVGASDWVAFGGNGVGPWVEDGSSSDSEDSTANDVGVNYDTPPEIIGTMEPEFEKIAALKPDLILDVRSSGDSARYEKLSAIAPTVGVPEGADNYLTPREDQVSMIATALGQKSRGEEVNREYSDRLAAIRADHPQWASMTVAAVSATASGWGAYVKGSNRVDTLLDLGFQQNSVLAAEKTGETGFSVKLSDETLSKADSDLVVGFAVGLSPEEMADRGPWKDLAATKERRSFVMPKELSSAFSLGSPQSTRFALDKLVPLLEEHTRAK